MKVCLPKKSPATAEKRSRNETIGNSKLTANSRFRLLLTHKLNSESHSPKAKLRAQTSLTSKSPRPPLHHTSKLAHYPTVTAFQKVESKSITKYIETSKSNLELQTHELLKKATATLPSLDVNQQSS